MISKLLSSEQKAILKTKFSSCKNEAYNDILAAEVSTTNFIFLLMHFYILEFKEWLLKRHDSLLF